MKGPFYNKGTRDFMQLGGDRGNARDPRAIKRLKARAAKMRKPPFKKGSDKCSP